MGDKREWKEHAANDVCYEVYSYFNILSKDKTGAS